jgi:hypothetical protein
MSFAATAIMAPTMMSVQPVAQGGMDAKIGAKKMEMKKQIPVVIAVRPVLPPSEIPAPDSINAVTGERPKSEPIEIPNAGEWMSASIRGREGMWGYMYHLPGKRLRNPRNLEFPRQWHQRSGPLSTEFPYSLECQRKGR